MKRTNRRVRIKNKTQRGGVGIFSRGLNLFKTAAKDTSDSTFQTTKDKSDSTFQTINSSRCSLIQDLDEKKNCLVENTYFSDDEKRKILRKFETNQTDNTAAKSLLKFVTNAMMKSVDEDWVQMSEYDTIYKTGNQFKQLLISKLTKFTKNLTKEQRVKANREFRDSVYKLLNRSDTDRQIELNKLKLLNTSDTDRQIELNQFIEDTAEEDAITVATERAKKEMLLRNACINPDGTPIENCSPMAMGGRTKRYRRRKVSRRIKTNKRRY
jgi:hypothetical protein